jgi:hypothetical protein
MTQLILFFVLTSLLIIGLAIPLIRGQIKPNHWYGFRITLTLNHPHIWYPANCYTGWLLLIYGLVLLVVFLVLPIRLSGLPEEEAMSIYGLAVAAVMLAGLLPVVILSLRYANSLAREAETDDSSQVP